MNKLTQYENLRSTLGTVVKNVIKEYSTVSFKDGTGESFKALCTLNDPEVYITHPESEQTVTCKICHAICMDENGEIFLATDDPGWSSMRRDFFDERDWFNEWYKVSLDNLVGDVDTLSMLLMDHTTIFT